jgi:HSP20 family protein
LPCHLFKPDEINVSANDGVLTIWGGRRQEDRQEHEGFVRTERRYGTFYRTVPLPEDTDEGRISATFRDGVLEMTVPVCVGSK